MSRLVAEKQNKEREQGQNCQKANTTEANQRGQNILERFDFERYITYLQYVLPDVVFFVGGFLVTRDKVFALAVLWPPCQQFLPKR